MSDRHAVSPTRPASRRRPRAAIGLAATALLVVVLGAGAPRPATAQTEAELRQRIDSLTPLWEEASRQALVAAEARRQAARTGPPAALDTLRVGPLTVITLATQGDLARVAFRQALQAFTPWIAGSRAATSRVFTFQVSDDPVAIPVEGTTPSRVELGPAGRPLPVVVDAVERAVGSVLSAELQSSRVGRWFSGPVAEPADPGHVYRVLAGLPAAVNQRCMAGDAAACWTALGLDLDAFPFDDWYDAAQRRSMVARMSSPASAGYRDTTVQDLWTECTGQGVVAACDDFMAHRFIADVHGPLGRSDARPAMVVLALQAGGADAWSRLTSDPDMEPGEALRRASGLSSEELGARWRARIIEHRPERQAGLGAMSLATLLWTLAFAALATRSTRWRLG